MKASLQTTVCRDVCHRQCVAVAFLAVSVYDIHRRILTWGVRKMKKYLIIVMCLIMCAAGIMAVSGCSMDNASEGEEELEEYDGNTESGTLSEGDEAPDFTADLVGFRRQS